MRITTLHLAAFIGLATIASPALSEYRERIAVSPPGEHAAVPDLAIDADGNALIAWQVRRPCPSWSYCWLAIKARARSRTGDLGPIKLISVGTSARQNWVTGARIVFDPDGDALVVWNGAGTQALTLSKTGQLGPIEILSPANADSAKVAMDDDGNALIVWKVNGSNLRVGIQGRVRSNTGELRPIRVIAPLAEDVTEFDLAMNPDGNAVVVWARDYPEFGVRARPVSIISGPGLVQTIAGPNSQHFDPRIAMNANGDAVFVWHNFTEDRIQGRARSTTGALSAVQIVNAGGHQPQVAIDAQGNALFAWEGRGVRTRARASTGTLGPIESIAPYSSIIAFSLAMNDEGNAVIAWPGGARMRSKDGSLGPIQKPLSNVQPIDVDTTLNSAGQVHVVMGRKNEVQRIWAAIGP